MKRVSEISGISLKESETVNVDLTDVEIQTFQESLLAMRSIQGRDLAILEGESKFPKKPYPVYSGGKFVKNVMGNDKIKYLDEAIRSLNQKIKETEFVLLKIYNYADMYIRNDKQNDLTKQENKIYSDLVNKIDDIVQRRININDKNVELEYIVNTIVNITMEAFKFAIKVTSVESNLNENSYKEDILFKAIGIIKRDFDKLFPNREQKEGKMLKWREK